MPKGFLADHRGMLNILSPQLVKIWMKAVRTKPRRKLIAPPSPSMAPRRHEQARFGKGKNRWWRADIALPVAQASSQHKGQGFFPCGFSRSWREGQRSGQLAAPPQLPFCRSFGPPYPSLAPTHPWLPFLRNYCCANWVTGIEKNKRGRNDESI